MVKILLIIFFLLNGRIFYLAKDNFKVHILSYHKYIEYFSENVLLSSETMFHI